MNSSDSLAVGLPTRITLTTDKLHKCDQGSQIGDHKILRQSEQPHTQTRLLKQSRYQSREVERDLRHKQRRIERMARRKKSARDKDRDQKYRHEIAHDLVRP